MSATTTPSSTIANTDHSIDNLDLSDLPALPEIPDAVLKDLAVTHKSMVTNDAQTVTKNFLKLAHLGDGLLNAIVTCKLHQLFPVQKAGQATKLRGKLINQEILAKISFAYGIPDHVKTDTDSLGRSAIQRSEDNACEMFEAHIAAVFLSQNDVAAAYKLVNEWLCEVFTPIANHFYDPNDMTEAEEDKAAEGAKANLYLIWSRAKYPVIQWARPVAVDRENEKGTEGRRWHCKINAADNKGRTWYAQPIPSHPKDSHTHASLRTGEAMRDTVKQAENVACWKVYQKIQPNLRITRWAVTIS